MGHPVYSAGIRDLFLLTTTFSSNHPGAYFQWRERWNLDWGTLNLDGGTRPPYNLSTGSQGCSRDRLVREWFRRNNMWASRLCCCRVALLRSHKRKFIRINWFLTQSGEWLDRFSNRTGRPHCDASFWPGCYTVIKLYIWLNLNVRHKQTSQRSSSFHHQEWWIVFIPFRKQSGDVLHWWWNRFRTGG